MSRNVYKNNKTLDTSRRKLLEFVGKSGFTSAALKSSSLLAGVLANRFAHANGNSKRVVFVYTPMGAPNNWLPNGDRLSPSTQGFAGVQADCFFHSVEIPNGGFGAMRSALGEIRWQRDWTSDTIDHQIATVLGMSTPFQSLHFGVHTRPSGRYDSFSWRNGANVVPMDNANESFVRLFGAESETHFTRSKRKQAIFDTHLKSLDCNRKLLSTEEARTIDQYEQSLTEISEAIAHNRINPPACQLPQFDYTAVPGAPAYGRFMRDAELQADIITQMLACGLTNVATLQLGDEEGNFICSDPNYPFSIHQITCGISSEALYESVINDLSACIGYLIKQLAERDDPTAPGSKLLDNTLVVQVSSLGYGPNHTTYPAPCVVATRLPQFNTGAAISKSFNGVTNLQVLQSIAVGLGLEQYIGKESHHCIWPCGGEGMGIINASLLA